MTLVAFGQRLEHQEEEKLTVAAARAAVGAVREDRNFRLLELRRDDVSEILIVECRTHVFSKNACGIRFREPLALRFFRDASKLPEVRALRSDFPELLHENEQEPGEPVGLCVYQEPWAELRRTWTPQRFLGRIRWWLKAASEGKLHPPELAPEQLFFDSFITVVLPEDFDELCSRKDQALALEGRSPRDGSKWVVNATFRPVRQFLQNEDRNYALIALTLPEISHGRPERRPETLGQLHERLAKRGAPIDELLFREILRLSEGGFPHVLKQKTLLILTVPVKNPGGSTRIERRGFLIDAGMGELGVQAGVLDRSVDPNTYVSAHLFGELRLKPQWHATKIIAPVELREAFTPEKARRYSGIQDAGPHGVLAGYGALGSAIAENWVRAGWGQWDFIDPDLIYPHNLARHRAWEPHVGQPKVAVAQSLYHALFRKALAPHAVHASANHFDEPEVLKLLQGADLIVDVTTSIGVPRDFSKRDDLRRCASAFITPTGNDSVLLMEDAKRIIRLDCLEPQYYRFILNASWSETHLKGHRGELYIGAGCRDISGVIPGELVQLHGALLARQIRLRSAEHTAQIMVWRAHSDTGEVRAHPFGVSLPRVDNRLGFEIVWDEGLRTKLRDMRERALPKESGGVLLGYADNVTGRIYVVDALSPPPDSYQSRAEFQRGVQGLADRVGEAATRTANIVTYIGEWHSHPRGIEADLSGTDLFQLVELALLLRQDGAPALMLIVGESGESWFSCEVR